MEFVPMEDLTTEHLILRKLRPEDARDYFDRIGSREEVTRYMLWKPHKSIEDSIASMEKARRGYETGTGYKWGIARKEDDRIVGVIDLLRFEEDGSCSFAYMLTPQVWGRGYGTEAVRAVFAFGFDRMELTAIRADHMTLNGASGAVMRKAGMVWQGTTPAKYVKDGVAYDADAYAVTAQQWRDFIGKI